MSNTNQEELVDLYVHRGYDNDDPNEFISLNGKNYILPKGKTSKVPPAVKKQYERSLKAKEKQYENSEKLIEEGKKGIQLT